MVALRETFAYDSWFKSPSKPKSVNGVKEQPFSTAAEPAIEIKDISDLFQPKIPLASVISTVSEFVGNPNGYTQLHHRYANGRVDYRQINVSLNAVNAKASDIVRKSSGERDLSHLAVLNESPLSFEDFAHERVVFGLVPQGDEGVLQAAGEYAAYLDQWNIQHGNSPEQQKKNAVVEAELVESEKSPPAGEIKALSQLHIPFLGAATTIIENPTVTLDDIANFGFAQALAKFYPIAAEIERKGLGQINFAEINPTLAGALDTIAGCPKVIKRPNDPEKEAIMNVAHTMKKQLGPEFNDFIVNFPNLAMMYYNN